MFFKPKKHLQISKYACIEVMLAENLQKNDKKKKEIADQKKSIERSENWKILIFYGFEHSKISQMAQPTSEKYVILSYKSPSK